MIKHFAPHLMYVESYGGGCSVLGEKSPSLVEVYNDLDSEVVNVFRVLRDPEQAARLVELLRLTPYSRSEYFAAQQPSDDPVEQARRTIVKSGMGRGSEAVTGNTGFRLGSRTGALKAGSSQDWSNYPDCLAAWVDRLRCVVIENRPAIDVIRWADRQARSEETLYYCDPPYVHSTRSKDSYSRYRHEMTDADHCEMAVVLKSVRGMVALSGYPSELYNDLFPDWIAVCEASHACGAKSRVECLWLNPALVERLERVHA